MYHIPIYLYIYWVISIASQVLFDLREKRAYEPGQLAFVEGLLPDMGARSDRRKAHQATLEPWEVSPHRGLLSLGCLCLTPFAW